MKLKSLLFAALLFAACSKSSDDKAANGSHCWECELSGYLDGRDSVKKDTCTNSENAPHFTDENGNELNSLCKLHQ